MARLATVIAPSNRPLTRPVRRGPIGGAKDQRHCASPISSISYAMPWWLAWTLMGALLRPTTLSSDPSSPTEQGEDVHASDARRAQDRTRKSQRFGGPAADSGRS